MTSKPKRPYSVEHEAGYQAGLKNLSPAADSENYRAGHARYSYPWGSGVLTGINEPKAWQAAQRMGIPVP